MYLVLYVGGELRCFRVRARVDPDARGTVRARAVGPLSKVNFCVHCSLCRDRIDPGWLLTWEASPVDGISPPPSGVRSSDYFLVGRGPQSFYSQPDPEVKKDAS